MDIPQKLQLDYAGLVEHGAINIVVFGDSVTHGAVAPGEINYETVYWNRLRKKLNEYRNYTPINVINSGIGGITAPASLPRFQRDVLAYHPDLVIVCFGLNDINLPMEDYTGALQEIFEKCQAASLPVIFMTPNMLNTYVHPNTASHFLQYAATTAEYQNSGKMDSYMDAACAVARKMGVSVCDCYSRWKQLQKEGVDTTLLLANYINHPTEEMHSLFADMLYDMIMEQTSAPTEESSTMYHQ